MPSPLSFLPSMRVRSGKHFERAYRQGSRARSEQLLVVAVENGLGTTRLGLSVGKRIWKHAHRRNRVRRVFREAFRLTYQDLPKGLDLILIPASPQLEPDLEQVKRELVMLAHKAHQRQLQKQAESEDPA
ncbi:MAG: ribonuclease P protein component [Planctomycetota bacterium]|jgi:ribonuclease P protein component|nr:ribonuclease P protein component [Planctomycetota bacterium]MDP6739788.1 ribonuclease P protein component [Planctomycetota bacterium]MDP6938793.1 ribonuclease P protein component [Planctomycetota bacterium]